MAGKIDMSQIKDPELRRQLESALATIGDPQPGGTDAPASPLAGQPIAAVTAADRPATAGACGSGPTAEHRSFTIHRQWSLGSGEYSLKGDYQWKCHPIGAVTTTGNFDLTVKVPKAEGLLYFDNFTRFAEGTVKAAGDIRSHRWTPSS